MRQNFSFTSPIDRPDAGEAFRASVRKPDLADLAETVAVAANDITAASSDLFRAHYLPLGPAGLAYRGADAMSAAKAAAYRVIEAVAAYERVQA